MMILFCCLEVVFSTFSFNAIHDDEDSKENLMCDQELELIVLKFNHELKHYRGLLQKAREVKSKKKILINM